MSSNIEVKEIVYHCQCRRYVEGTPQASCICLECGREHSPMNGYPSDIGSAGS